MSLPALLLAIVWLGVFVTVYAYVLFPALVIFLAQLHRRRIATANSQSPMVTVIIPAYNEEGHIGSKIQNTLSSTYDRGLLEVIVVSDGSTDRTNQIARSFEPHGARLIVQNPRQGKTAGLNRAVATAQGEILVLTDANAAYGPETLDNLVRYFADPSVGLVTGYTRYRLTESGHVSETTNAYTSLERLIKRGESAWGCCVGADGAIFAMRRSLYRPLRYDDINDFVLPLSVIDQGYRCLFADDAVCSESSGEDLDSEFRRQSRITNRTLRALWRHAHLLNPIVRPAFAFFLLSHKVIRFLVPVALTLSAAALAMLATSGRLYLALTAALFVLVTAALAWDRAFKPNRVLQIIKSFLMINLAMLDGWRKFLSGERDVMWQPDRNTVEKTAGTAI